MATREEALAEQSQRLQDDPEYAKEFSEKGRKSAMIKRQEKATFKRVLDDIMDLPCLAVEEYTAWTLENYPGVDYRSAISLAMVKRALMGDVAAAAFVRDTMGENPKTLVDLNSDKDTEINIRVLEGGSNDKA